MRVPSSLSRVTPAWAPRVSSMAVMRSTLRSKPRPSASGASERAIGPRSRKPYSSPASSAPSVAATPGASRKPGSFAPCTARRTPRRTSGLVASASRSPVRAAASGKPFSSGTTTKPTEPSLKDCAPGSPATRASSASKRAATSPSTRARSVNAGSGLKGLTETPTQASRASRAKGSRPSSSGGICSVRASASRSVPAAAPAMPATSAPPSTSRSAVPTPSSTQGSTSGASSSPASSRPYRPSANAVSAGSRRARSCARAVGSRAARASVAAARSAGSARTVRVRVRVMRSMMPAPTMATMRRTSPRPIDRDACGGRQPPEATRASERRAAATTFAGVNPNASKSTSPGAEAPNRSMPTTSPSSPT